MAGSDVDPTQVPTVAGATVIAARAVSSIARRAAGEVDGVELVSRSGLGRFFAGLLPGGGGAGGASAEVGHGSASLALHLSVGWPRPIGEVAEDARRHVRARVTELTGYTVSDIDVVVDALPEPGSARPRRVS